MRPTPTLSFALAALLLLGAACTESVLTDLESSSVSSSTSAVTTTTSEPTTSTSSTPTTTPTTTTSSDPSTTPGPSLAERRGETCGDGTCDPEENAIDCPEDCSERAVALFDPTAPMITRFPDDFLTRPAPETRTGLRLDIDLERYTELRRHATTARRVLPELNELDGFGTTAGGYFRFSAPVDPATFIEEDGETPERASSALYAASVLDDGTLLEIPLEAIVLPGDRRVLLRPMLPLEPTSESVFVLTSDARDAEGRPILRAPWFDALMQGGEGEPLLEEHAERYARITNLLISEGVVADADAIVTMTVFTTQSIFEDSLALADMIADRTYTRTADAATCSPQEGSLRCEFTFDVGIWRNPESGRIEVPDDGQPYGTHTLTAAVYLPENLEEVERPLPTAIFGHGLGGDRRQARRLAAALLPEGIAVIAIDAPKHGDHPNTPATSGEFTGVLEFLGVTSGRFSGLTLRDNWREATLDKLGLMELLIDGIDANDDGTVDLDPERITYLGASLGSIMGPEFLALTPHIDAAVLVIGGSRVTDILRYSPDFSGVVSLLFGTNVPEEMNVALFPKLQSLVDQGDSGNWAPWVMRQRFDGRDGIQVLHAMALNDEVVPDETNLFMARALGTPQVPPILKPAGVVPVTDEREFAGNMPDGGTAAYMQFDLIFRNGEWQPTSHSRLPEAEVGMITWVHFLKTFYDTGVGEVIDPYERLGNPRPD